MYKPNKHQKSSININNSTEGETIEQKINRVVNNKEPITDGAPIIHTERKAGVVAGYNPRTDKWEIALDAMDAVNKDRAAKYGAVMNIVKDEEEPDNTGETKGESKQN